MARKNLNNQRGFLSIIVLVIIGVLLLWYFNIDVRGAVNSPAGQGILAKAKEVWDVVWSLIKGPVTQLWDYIINNLVPGLKDHLNNPPTPAVGGK